MNDPREALRTNVAHWLRVRATVRVMENKLVAAQYALERDARRSDDPAMIILGTQLATERREITLLARELDERIAQVQRDCAACETQFVTNVIAAAHTTRPIPRKGAPFAR